MFVRRARDVIVPYSAANRVEHDALKTMIVSNWPVAFAGLRKRRHRGAGQMQIVLDKGEVGRLWQVETPLHLIFR